MKKPDTKTRLLLAAGRIVLEQGVNGLTLDAVAEAAGLSKGGLFYHYDSKEELIAALVAHSVATFEARIERACADDRSPGAWTRAYLAAAFPPRGTPEDREAALEVALIAALGNEPRLLRVYRERQSAWDARLRSDGIEPALAYAVRLAVDGLWMNEAFGLHPLPEAERRRVLRALVDLTRRESGKGEG